jgi:glutamyl-tRNA synthetase
MSDLKPVRVRFAPSPTGYLHIGGARTALYNYLLAKQTGGQFLLRIEDTDQTRFVAGAMEQQMADLRWLGLQWDEGPEVGGPNGPYIQSQRAQIHRKYAEQLINEGKAYYCFCTRERLAAVREEQQRNNQQSRYDGHCRNIPRAEAKARQAAGEPCTVRFKVPLEGTTTVHDFIRGEITVENSTLDDFVILKTDGLSLYHLAAMVDDHDMGITHVIRSAEWLPSLPKHELIYQAFGWDVPVWVHLSVFLKPNGKGKMSKRDVVADHSILVKDLPALGYVPQAILNWVVLMGWSLDDKTEFFSMDELIRGFSLERVNPKPAAINFEKFDHFNGLHIRALAPSDLATRIQPFFAAQGIATTPEQLTAIVPLIQERLVTLDDAVEKAGFFFLAQPPVPKVTDLLPKGLAPDLALSALQLAQKVVTETVTDSKALEEQMLALATELNLPKGQLFTLLRGAYIGLTVTPPLFQTLEVLNQINPSYMTQAVANALSLLEQVTKA